MLKTRVLTALALIPLVILAIWYLPTMWLAVLVGLLILASAWEWALFLPAKQQERWTYVAASAVPLALLHPHVLGDEATLPLAWVGAIWWAVASLWLAVYPGGFGKNKPGKLLRAFIGWCILLPCFVGIWNIHELSQGVWLIFVLLVLVWATDTGGYFAGKQFGRNKMAPQISPKKTWEGLIGGVLLAMLLAFAAAQWLLEGYDPVRFTLLGLVVSLISIVGDLTISMFKRQTGIKDTGNLFPGHGGALDRLDSLFSAAPVFYLGLNLLF